MAHGEVIVDSGQTSLNGEELIKELPPYFPKDIQSHNFRLIDVIGRAVDRLDTDISAVDDASSVEEANTVEELEELAKLVELPPKNAESKEKYRTRILTAFQINTSEGTANDIIEDVSVVLNTKPKNIGYKQSSEPGVVILTFPKRAVDALAITTEELAAALQKQVSAGYRIEGQVRGTFTYISETDYNDTNFTHDATKAYDGLDANGDPKGNGGTYAGLVG